MPTPTIDPMAYEAAYEAMKQFKINEEIFYGIVGLAILFFIWMFKE